VGWQVYDITKRALEPRFGRAGAISSWNSSCSLFLATPPDRFEAAQSPKRVLCGISFVFRPFVNSGGAPHARGASDLRGAGFARSSALIQRHGQPLDLAANWFPEETFFQRCGRGNATGFSGSPTILGPSWAESCTRCSAGHRRFTRLLCLPLWARCSPCSASRREPQARRREPMTLKTVLAGLHFIWREKLILGAISLDLFAVLLAGQSRCYPCTHEKILHTGPLGLGLLRTAPGVGAAADGRRAGPSSRCAVALDDAAVVKWRGLASARFFLASRPAWCYRSSL